MTDGIFPHGAFKRLHGAKRLEEGAKMRSEEDALGSYTAFPPRVGCPNRTQTICKRKGVVTKKRPEEGRAIALLLVVKRPLV